MDEPTIIEKLENEPTEVVEAPVKRNNKKTGLAILITILFSAIVLPVAGLAYLLITGNLDYLGEKEIEVEEEIIEEEENDSVTWVDWEGRYFRSTLPENWQILELNEHSEYLNQYQFGAGVDRDKYDKPEFEFYGFVIKDSNNEDVFLFEPIQLMGEECSYLEYIQFNDEPFDSLKTEIDRFSEENNDNTVCEGDVDIRIIRDFKEVKFFDLTIRYDNYGEFYSNLPTYSGTYDMYEEFGFISYENNKLEYLSSSGVGSDYWFRSIPENLSSSEIETLAIILESMEIKHSELTDTSTFNSIDSSTEYGSVKDGTAMYLQTILPEGWDVKEYYIDYTNALSGINIIYDNNSVLELLPSDKIMGQGGCTKYLVFPDDDPNNYDDVKVFETAIQNSGGEVSIEKIAAGEYEELTILKNKWRRVENHYYVDTISDDEYFTANCPDSDLFLALENSEGKFVAYSHTYGDLPMDDYSDINQIFSVLQHTQDLSEGELLDLDSVLESIEIIRDYKEGFLIGSWDMSESTGGIGGFERYVFRRDGTYTFYPSDSVSDSESIIHSDGKWSLANNVITLDQEFLSSKDEDTEFISERTLSDLNGFEYIRSADYPFRAAISGSYFWKYADIDIWTENE